MSFSSFYHDVLTSELACVEYLQGIGLISERADCDCGSEMKLRVRNRRGCVSVIWRCKRKSCSTERSVRSECCFFGYKHIDGRMRASISLCKIIELLFLYLNTHSTTRQLESSTNLSSHTVVDWCNLFREVFSHSIESAEKMIGTPENPVQIDEAYFRGRRKYNRGRYLSGNDLLANSNTSHASRSNNYGDLVQGPWVLGIYQSAQNVRYIVVDDRRGSTLIPLIKKYVAERSTIVTDEWGGYNGLQNEGYEHETVCNKDNYVNPVTGYHTQGVERCWVDAKAWLKRSRYPSPYMQSHLDEVSWRKMNATNFHTLINAFLYDVGRFYNTHPE